jgi:hypothetical protein
MIMWSAEGDGAFFSSLGSTVVVVEFGREMVVAVIYLVNHVCRVKRKRKKSTWLEMRRISSSPAIIPPRRPLPLPCPSPPVH